MDFPTYAVPMARRFAILALFARSAKGSSAYGHLGPSAAIHTVSNEIVGGGRGTAHFLKFDPDIDSAESLCVSKKLRGVDCGSCF